MKLIGRLLGGEGVLVGAKPSEMSSRLPSALKSTAGRIVDILLAEASVHPAKRSQVWVASFTGPTGGQKWRSTGLTDHDQALLVARKWEAEARAERARLGRTARKPIVRVHRRESGPEFCPLTQKEVALLLNLSERAVRGIERRAFQKLRNHPLLRDVWQRYLAGELDEHQPTLTQEEVEALFNLIRTPAERQLVEKVVGMIHSDEALRLS